MTEESNRKYSKQKVAVVTLVGMIIGICFNSVLLYNWANQIKDGRVRSILLYAIEPLYNFCRKTNLNWLPEKMQNLFYAFSGIKRDAGWAAAGIPGSSTTDSAVLSLLSTPAPSSAHSTALTAGPAAITQAPGVTQPGAPGTGSAAGTLVSENVYSFPAREKLYAAVPDVAYSAAHPLQVFILGDSMVADSLSPAFRRITENNPAIVYAKKSRYSSGLSRPDYFNWPAEITEHYKSASYDLVIVMLGMNDAQDVIIDKQSCYYGTEKWFAIYKTRVNDFVSLLLTASKRVYWLGMPPMRGALYNSRMEQLNKICTEVCAIYPDARFIPTTDLVTGTDRKYIAHLTLDNKLVKVRADDGKHMTQAGAALVIAEVIKRINEDFAFAGTGDTATAITDEQQTSKQSTDQNELAAGN